MRAMTAIRRSATRWAVLHDVVRTTGRLVRACTYLDGGRRVAMDKAVVVERELDALVRALDRESTRLTLEYAQTYLRTARRRAERKVKS